MTMKGIQTAQPETGPIRRVTCNVYVQAESVAYLGQGLYRISMDGVEPTEIQTKVIRELFPNISDQVFDLLAKEAILGSLFKGQVTQKMHEREEVFRPANKD